MTLIIDTSMKSLVFGRVNAPCRIGMQGAVAGSEGREGDQKTPLGHYHLRFGLYRADRLPAPKSPLTFRPLRPDDGWCDAPNDAAYNRFIRLPYPASHERLWREDGAYDLVIVMSHNDSPPSPHLGSAVFIHVAQPDDRQTLGCIALTPEAFTQLLPHLHTGMAVEIM